MGIAHELREARLRAGLSQKRLAERIGIDPGLVSNVERGLKSTSLRNIDAWFEACGRHVAAVPAEQADPGELADLPPKLLELVLRLARLLPRLPPVLVRDLDGRLASWAIDYSASEAPIAQDSRASVR